MIGWTVPPKKAPRKRFVSRQTKMAEKATERKAVKNLMAAAEGWNDMNLYWGDIWLRQRAEFGETDYRIKYGIRVMARLRPELEF